MEIWTHSNNVLCIKDTFIMERTDELFISTPLQIPFILDNIWLDQEYPFHPKIMRKYRVDSETADKYLEYCIEMFEKEGNEKQYKEMVKEKLLKACIDKINKSFYSNDHRHQSHATHHSTDKHNPYHVDTHNKISAHNTRSAYNVPEDSDDKLPLPTNYFENLKKNNGKSLEYRASATPNL